MTVPDRRAFLEQYGRIRAAEGYGSSSDAYYRSLPFIDDPHWKIRAATFRYFVRHILPATPSTILDLGAGNAWLSNRLAELGHAPVAIDIFRDRRDGLAASCHYETSFPRLEAEFDHLPVASGRFDLAVFNASLHYSANYTRTLTEARRCLRPGGRIVVLDSPVYRLHAHGEAMRLERQALFERQYGFRSEALRSIEFLDEEMLATLAHELQFTWVVHRPWYGLAWHLRPAVARLAKRRPPARFVILEARFAREHA
jgi:SAM-dependent methyltransferase